MENNQGITFDATPAAEPAQPAGVTFDKNPTPSATPTPDTRAFTVPSVGLGDRKTVITPAPQAAPKAAPAAQPYSPKAGFDLGTAQETALAVPEAIGGVVKGGFQLAGKELAYGLAGSPHEDVEKQMEAESEALKQRVYAKFKDDFRKGNYVDAMAGLTHLFTEAKGDPNEPAQQMIDEQLQSSKAAKDAMMEAAKKGDWAATAQHAVGMAPFANDVDAAMERFRANPTRDNLKEVVMSAVPAFIPSIMKGTGKLAGMAKDYTGAAIAERTVPTTEESPMGAQIPVRQEGRLATSVAAHAPEEAAKFAQTETAPAVQKAVGGTIGEAIGSEAATTITPEDRFGLKGHATDRISEAQNTFKRIDEQTDNALTKAQRKIDKGWAMRDAEAVAEGESEKAGLFSKFRDQLKSEGLDIDEAEANYRKGKTAERMAKRLDAASVTGPSDIDGVKYDLKGDGLRNVIDTGIKNGSWKRMGLTDAHIAELESLGKIAAEQTSIPKTSAMLRGLGKLAVAVSGLHYGFLPAVEAVTGMSAADYVGGKLAQKVMQDAMMDYGATKALKDAFQTGDVVPVVDTLSKNPSWMDKIKSTVSDLYKRYQNLGETGAVGAKVARKRAGMTAEGKAGVPVEKPLPTNDELVEKYGEGSGDPAHTAFILDDGRTVAQSGGNIHDQMLGGKTTDSPAPRERFINKGGIRMRSYGSYGDRQFSLSIPSDGVSPEQMKTIMKMAPQMGSGRVYLETPKLGDYRIVDYGKASSELEKTIRDFVGVKGEKGLEEAPEAHKFAEMRAEHLSKGGATFSPEGKNLAGTDAWSVGAYPERTENVPDEEFNPDAIQKFADKNKDVLSKKDHAIGSWRDPDTKENVLDVVRLMKDDAEAKALGASKDQKAIYHLGRGELADTGGTGGALAAGEPAANLSGPGAEGAGSLEAISREQSRAAQGLRVYDVDTRKGGAKSGWNPLFGVDIADRQAAPGHVIVEVGPDGRVTQTLSEGTGARPLPTADRIQELVKQAAPEVAGTTRPEVAAEAAYRSGLADKEIGTRQPFSADADLSNDPSKMAGLDALNEADKMSPSRTTQTGKPVLGVKQKLVAALSDYKYNGISGLLDAVNPDEAIEKFVNHAKENLKWLHNVSPEVIRDTARQWYETAYNTTKKLAQDNGITHEQSAAVTAALSPQNDWNNNVGQAQRLIEHWRNDQGHAWTTKMDDAFSQIRNGGAVSEPMRRMVDTMRGKRYNQLTAKSPEALLAKKAMWIRILDEAHSAPDTPIYAPDGSVQGSQTLAWNSVDPMAKALSILEDGSVENINRSMGLGHKIRNFYNNIINPWSDRGHVTVDTHQVGASLLKPFSGDDIEVAHNFGSGNRAGTPSPAKHAGTGLRGSYPVYEEAVRRAADELGIQPRELQSITWEAIRSLMGDEKKTPELRRAINDIWRAHEDGQITLAQAREEILKASGGFAKPNWITDEDWEKAGGTLEPGQTDFAFGANQ